MRSAAVGMTARILAKPAITAAWCFQEGYNSGCRFQVTIISASNSVVVSSGSEISVGKCGVTF